jgi:hypothetical protein
MLKRKLAAVLATALTALLAVGCTADLEPPAIDPAFKAELQEYIESNHMTPEDYVIAKFADHDVVFIGEQHRIKHDVELIRGLIPKLFEAGVFTLGTEFGRREDQARIDKLLDGPAFDETLALAIMFDQSVFWGYREYVDVYRAAWELNHTLPDTAKRFRILGLNDSPDWSHVRKAEDRDDPAIMEKVWRGGGEVYWAEVLLDEVVVKGEKALVHCGIHHAFTEYRQPVFNEENQEFIRFVETRMGNCVYDEIGKRAITIYLHAPWNSAAGYGAPLVQPVDGIIEAVMVDLAPQWQPVGFDTKGTPFGRLPGETSIYKHGYDDFSLADFCGGYIFHMPISQFLGVTPIDGFVNESNIERARRQSPNPRYREASIDEFNSAIARDAEIPRRFRSAAGPVKQAE